MRKANTYGKIFIQSYNDLYFVPVIFLSESNRLQAVIFIYHHIC